MGGRETALEFVQAIDSRDFGRVEALITSDHVFAVNGEEHRGRDALRRAWSGWWSLVPDLRTRVQEVLEADDRVIVRMIASGSSARWNGLEVSGEWSFPVAAIARIENGKVAEWREYCDPSPLWALLQRGAP